MQVTNQISWAAATWPAATAAAQYTVLQVYPGGPTPLQNTTTTSATLTYDDTSATVYQVRPSSGLLSGPLTYGPETYVYVVNYVPCRAWLRNKVRAALADTDTGGAALNWSDDDLNGYVNESLTELNMLFPLEIGDTRITLLPPTLDGSGNSNGTRVYPLPTDFYLMRSVEYVTIDGIFRLFLKEKPYKGGETTATTIMGYPKLGIMLSPMSGRFYPGHFWCYAGQLHIDWDPAGDGDFLNLTYLGRRPYPVNDADILSLMPEDIELMNIYCQMKAWFRVAGQDSRLSRWTEGHKRDDQPILRQVDMLQKLYNQRLIDRRELRPVTRRLVRR